MLDEMEQLRQRALENLHEMQSRQQERVKEEIERLMKKFPQDQPREKIINAAPFEEGNLLEANALEMLALVIQMRILHDQLLETSQKLTKQINGDLSLIKDIDDEVAYFIEHQANQRRADVATTIYYRRAKGTLKTLEELPNDDMNHWSNHKQPPEEKFLTLQDLLRIVKLAIILSISLILPGYLYFAGLQLGWALALFIGFLVVAWLGYSIKR